jgi:beta-glucosidase/6-phospho-beta-glucosidase/beta-galactosidase
MRELAARRGVEDGLGVGGYAAWMAMEIVDTSTPFSHLGR